jgi:general secretion pathway protein C
MLKRCLTFKRVTTAAYLALGAFLLAHTVNAFVADALRPPPMQLSAIASNIPSEPQPEAPRMLADAIVTRGLFPLPPGSDGSLGSGQASEPPAPPLNVAKKVLLLGTAVNSRTGGLVVLEDLSSKNTQMLYHLHETVPGVGTIAQIENDRALFTQGTQEEWLNLAIEKLSPGFDPKLSASTQPAAPRVASTQPATLRPASPRPSPLSSRGKMVVERQLLIDTASDTARLYYHAQPIAFTVDGRHEGIRLDGVNFYGFYGKLGLRSGDVLKRVNGLDLRDPTKLPSIVHQLKNERSFSLDFLRDGSPQTLTYEVQ